MHNINMRRDEFLGTSKQPHSLFLIICVHICTGNSNNNNNKARNIEFVQEQQNVRRRKKTEAVFGKRAKFSKSNHDLGHLVKNCTIFSALYSAPHIYYFFISVNFAMCKKNLRQRKNLWMEELIGNCSEFDIDTKKNFCLLIFLSLKLRLEIYFFSHACISHIES